MHTWINICTLMTNIFEMNRLSQVHLLWKGYFSYNSQSNWFKIKRENKSFIEISHENLDLFSLLILNQLN